MKKKQGISLIVLVITIIVMIILATSVVISLNNTQIINKASQAVQLTDEKQVQDLASILWAETYLEGKRDEQLVIAVKEKLADQGITETKWDITISDTGIAVETASEFGIKFKYIYQLASNKEQYDFIFFEDGSYIGWLFDISNGNMKIKNVEFKPAGTCVYSRNTIVIDGREYAVKGGLIDFGDGLSLTRKPIKQTDVKKNVKYVCEEINSYIIFTDSRIELYEDNVLTETIDNSLITYYDAFMLINEEQTIIIYPGASMVALDTNLIFVAEK